MREIGVVVDKPISIRRNVVCLICKRKILTSEKYYRSGHKIHGVRGYGFRTFCADCLEKLYCDSGDS